jgi:hypothetical protein
MKRLLFLCLLLSFSAHSRIEDCSAFYPSGSTITSCDYRILAHYRQTSYRAQDHLGDYVLLKGLDLRIKEKLNLALGKKDIQNELRLALFDEDNKVEALKVLGLPPTEGPVFASKRADFEPHKVKVQVLKSGLSEDQKNVLLSNPDKIFFEGKKNPLKVDGLIKMFSQVINEEKFKTAEGCSLMGPTLGEEPRWAEGDSIITGKRLRSKFKIFSKLLVALAMGETNAYMFIGTEHQLRDWVFSQEDRSVTFEMIFRKSYQLNCGNVSNTILTILNMLSEHFRVPDRQKLLQTTKLAPIINHLGNGEDTFGPWYHFFGLMIYGYHHGTFTGTIMANIEKGTSLFYNEVDERQENYMVGALKVGREIRKLIQTERIDKSEMNPDFLKSENYLDLTEDFTKRIEKAFK